MTSGDGAATALTHRPDPVGHLDDEWHQRRWRLASLAVVVLLVAIGVTAFIAGEKQSTYGELVGAVVDGDVSQVEIHGVPEDGATRLVVRWRETVGHYAEVRIVRRAAAGTSGDTQVTEVVHAPADFLRSLEPGLSIDERAESRVVSWSIAGWSGPFALWWMALATIIAVLVLIISGPEPWRATRWAWFWLFALASPIGLVAYVLLAGPVVRPAPADRTRRLTGGWAFLLAWLVLGSFVGGRPS